MSLNVRIYGPPVAQGSMKGFAIKGRAIITANNAAKLKPWRQEIAGAAIEAGWKPLDGPVLITAMFYVRRPPSRPKKYGFPDKRPDLDKLLRAVLDALKGIAWQDDGQVVDAHVHKRYATRDDPEGVLLHVEGANA